MIPRPARSPGRPPVAVAPAGRFGLNRPTDWTETELPMPPSRGRSLALSPARRLVGDLLHFARRMPRPLRRFLWWAVLNLSGPQRALRMGTFGVTAYSALGAESLHPISPLTTTLTYGVIAPDGGVTVRVTYDHRVLDGAAVARAL